MMNFLREGSLPWRSKQAQRRFLIRAAITFAALLGIVFMITAFRRSQPRRSPWRGSTTGTQIFANIHLADTDGNFIQAHGGGIIHDSGYFYWFGEDKTGLADSGLFQGVNCYRSRDLGNWDFQEAVLSPIPNTNISSNHIVERPKVIYNARNKEYVMWFHNDDPTYGMAMVGVATSKTINGKYKWRGSFKPFGTDSRDFTIWQDPDDHTKAYLIFASDDNADFKIALLDKNFYGVETQLYEWENVYWEAPGVFKIDQIYYLLYSKQDGWNPVDNYYISAPSMAGPWSDPRPLAPEGLFAYNTQNAYDITIKGSQGTVHLYYGDHWNAPNLGASTYAFYPVTYNSYDQTISLSYSPAYSLDVERGIWIPLFPEATLTTDDLILPHPYDDHVDPIMPCEPCPSGFTLDLSVARSFMFNLPAHVAPGHKVLQFRYAYDGGKQEWNRLEVALDGQKQDSALLESTRNKEGYLHAPLLLRNMRAGGEVRVGLRDSVSRGGKVYITSVDVYEWTGV